MHDSVTIILKAIITKARFSKKEKKFNNGLKKKIDKGTSSSRTRPAAERKPNALGDERSRAIPVTMSGTGGAAPTAAVYDVSRLSRTAHICVCEYTRYFWIMNMNLT